MNLDTFTKHVQEALGDGLVSLTVYGSAATGDDDKRYSDINTLIVARELDLAVLKRLTDAISGWMKRGHPAPTLFTRERMNQSLDVFPIEILDMKERHRVLAGEDLLAELEVDTRHLRFQVEHELKGKFLQLREGYLLTGNKPRLIAELMVRSLSTFQLLFRAALRLYAQDESCGKAEAPQKLSTHIDFAIDPFLKVAGLRSGELKFKDLDMETLFENYLSSVAKVVDTVDSLET